MLTTNIIIIISVAYGMWQLCVRVFVYMCVCVHTTVQDSDWLSPIEKFCDIFTIVILILKEKNVNNDFCLSLYTYYEYIYKIKIGISLNVTLTIIYNDNEKAASK